jgi:predicted  nucleic acid-binding Zn-ribbon protein
MLQIRKQLKLFPPKLEALDRRIAQEKEELERHRRARTDHGAERRKLEGDVQELEAKIERERARLMEVKTNKEYAAVNHEIDILREKIDNRETRILELIEDEESHSQDIDESEKRFDAFLAEIEEERQRIDEQVRTKKEKLVRLGSARERQREKIPQDVLAKYDRLSERHPGDVVVPAVRNHCGGCHLNLVSQRMVEIRQMKSFIQCEGCLRIFNGEEEA